MRKVPPYTARFAELMRECQTRLKVDLSGLAELAEVPVSTMYKWVGCHAAPSKKRARSVCDKLGVASEWLFTPHANLAAAMQREYLDLAGQVSFWKQLRRQNNILEAVHMQAIVLLTIHKQLINRGVECEFRVGETLEANILFGGAYKGAGLIAYMSEEVGGLEAKMHMVDEHRHICGQVQKVTENDVEILAKTINLSKKISSQTI